MTHNAENDVLTMALAVAYYTPLGWALDDGEDVDPDDLAECLRAMSPVTTVVRGRLADAWDEALQAFAWAMEHDGGDWREALAYVAKTNPHRVTSPEECHCGRPVAYGFDGDPTHHRGMCAECDARRCDAYPLECPYR